MYSTRTRVHARIPNGHPREEKRACRTSRRTSRRGSSCVSGSWQAERGSRRTRRLPREDLKVGEGVRVGFVVGVGPVEFQLYSTHIYTESVADSSSKSLNKTARPPDRREIFVFKFTTQECKSRPRPAYENMSLYAERSYNSSHLTSFHPNSQCELSLL